MGVIFARGIVAVVILLVIIVPTVFLTIYFKKKADRKEALKNGWAIKGDLGVVEERQLVNANTAAADIMRSLIAPPVDLYQLEGERTLLSRDHREMVEYWLLNQGQKSITEIRKKVLGQ